MFQYSIILQWSDEDEGYVALVPELPGISAVGDNADEAVYEVQEAASLCLEAIKEEGETLPEPKKLLDYSGQLRIRMPRSLHERLATQSKMEGVSLNSYILHLLSSNSEKIERPTRVKTKAAQG